MPTRWIAVAMTKNLLKAHNIKQGFPHSSVGKESACNARDLGLIPGLERSSEEDNGHRLQYSCLEKPMDRGSWKATVHRVSRIRHDFAAKERKRKRTGLPRWR